MAKVIGNIIYYALCAAGGYLAGRAIFSTLGEDKLLLFLVGAFFGALVVAVLKRK